MQAQPYTTDLRRTLSAPTRNRRSLPPASLSSSSSPSSLNGGGEIHLLFAHADSRIVSFSTGPAVLREDDGGENRWRRSRPKTTWGELEAVRLAAWKSPVEKTIASGPLRIYKTVPHDVAFLQSGAALRPLLPKTRCWNVDAAQFVLQLRPGSYWRVEILGIGAHAAGAELQQVLSSVSAYELTACPFERDNALHTPVDERAGADVLQPTRVWRRPSRSASVHHDSRPELHLDAVRETPEEGGAGGEEGDGQLVRRPTYRARASTGAVLRARRATYAAAAERYDERYRPGVVLEKTEVEVGEKKVEVEEKKVGVQEEEEEKAEVEEHERADMKETGSGSTPTEPPQTPQTPERRKDSAPRGFDIPTKSCDTISQDGDGDFDTDVDTYAEPPSPTESTRTESTLCGSTSSPSTTPAASVNGWDESLPHPHPHSHEWTPPASPSLRVVVPKKRSISMPGLHLPPPVRHFTPPASENITTAIVPRPTSSSTSSTTTAEPTELRILRRRDQLRSHPLPSPASPSLPSPTSPSPAPSSPKRHHHHQTPTTTTGPGLLLRPFALVGSTVSVLALRPGSWLAVLLFSVAGRIAVRAWTAVRYRALVRDDLEDMDDVDGGDDVGDDGERWRRDGGWVGDGQRWDGTNRAVAGSRLANLLDTVVLTSGCWGLGRWLGGL